MKNTYILSAVRTPIGSFMGSLSSLSATDLGALAIKEALARSGVKADQVSETIMGCVLTSGLGQAPARQASKKAGLPNHVPATTVGKVCGSGLKAVMLGAQAIANGDAEVVVAGGMESMSNVPFLLPQARAGVRLGNATMVDALVHDGLWDVYNNFHMGTAAELCAKEYSFNRESQDAYAKQSYERALNAQTSGYFKKEIVPIEIKDRKGNSTFIVDDEEPKAVNFDKMASLKPVFDKNGTVTAANASSINDGAAALVLASEDFVKKHNLTPLAKISGFAQAAREPEWFSIAPADAIENLFKKLSWDKNKVDLFEINEAFSVVSLAVNQKLGLDAAKVNVHGGAVSLGHPIGASGARILVTLLHSLEQYKKATGVASLCIGGGEAVALGVEK
jgi:acetyl-CoA C-acetyltransferase